ncbi:hypothetical protein RF11_10869 [Thelohanellus kitauei]|uniref:Uncharacterized protein n=1 Tax=Thelohanellus kitauei TaxID=669202 RepID=A0A0C2N3J1_THEKT|nr:hypothetical protein RF11_10869 [Thelohanellus kitauei]
MVNVGCTHLQTISGHFTDVFAADWGYQGIVEFMARRHRHSTSDNECGIRSESIKEFFDAVKDLNIVSGFGNTADEKIGDQFVLPLQDTEIQKEIIRRYSSNEATLDYVFKEEYVISRS